MHKVKLRALLCQVGELNERELDELFDAVQKRQSATKALRVVENARWPLSCPSPATQSVSFVMVVPVGFSAICAERVAGRSARSPELRLPVYTTRSVCMRLPSV